MSVNHVPSPPNPFVTSPNLKTLRAGTELHRIYSSKYAGNAFNASEHILNRFSPIWQKGETVPVLYAGSSRAVAIYETLFHDVTVGLPAKRKALPIKALNKLYGSFITQRDLQIAPLHPPDLAKLGITIDQLTATNARYYPQTARWAEALHNSFPTLQGLEWTSYRGGPELAFVLFGDRVEPDDLQSSGNEVMIRADATVYDHAVECGLSVGVRIARTLP